MNPKTGVDRRAGMSNTPTVLHLDFYGWLAYTVIGLITISFLPEKLRLPLIALIVAGALAFMYNRNQVAGLQEELSRLRWISGTPKL